MFLFCIFVYMLVTCRLLTDTPSNFVPSSFKDVLLHGTTTGGECLLLWIQSIITRGYTASGMRLASLEQGQFTGIDGQEFFVEILSDYVPIVPLVIKIGSIELIVVNTTPNI